jgi:transposase
MQISPAQWLLRNLGDAKCDILKIEQKFHFSFLRVESMIIIPELFDQDLQVLQVTVADEITLTLCATSPTATCPDCGTISARIHSRYSRRLHDLPNRRRSVHLVVQVRRFRCQKSTCGRKIFAEQFPQLARPHAQRTLQLQATLCQVGMALGGQAGADLGSQLGLSGSRDTILRLLRAYQLPEATPPKKVGVDDWAWKRGHRYGTLLCDLDRGIAIDLLPDRSVETVAAWFREHPGVELISREGSYEYAAAAKKGAPQAIQVADRWHILKNLGKALASLLTAYFTAHRKKKTQEANRRKEIPFPQERSRKLSPQQAHLQQVHRDERIARYEQVMSLIKQGLTHRAIADQVGVGLTTIQNWLKAGTFPERKPREQSSQLDPYRSYVQKRRSEGYHNLMGIYRELQAQGYQGSYENVRVQFADPSQKGGAKRGARFPSQEALPSSRQASWLFLCRPEELTAKEQATVARLRQFHPEVDQAYVFVQQFVQMLRTRTAEQLDTWLEAVASSPLTDLQSFVSSVYEDKEAIVAGLSLPYSNGPTEGQIPRLKLIKRSMYGRAAFDLLRLRVLFGSKKHQKTQDAQTKVDHKRRRRRREMLREYKSTSSSQHPTFRITEVA